MKTDIHPEYKDAVKFTCNCGATYVAGSTMKDDFKTEICSSCHPFYTGKQKLIDTSGRVDKFMAKMKKAQEIAATKVKKGKEGQSAEELAEETAEEEAEAEVTEETEKKVEEKPEAAKEKAPKEEKSETIEKKESEEKAETSAKAETIEKEELEQAEEESQESEESSEDQMSLL